MGGGGRILPVEPLGAAVHDLGLDPALRRLRLQVQLLNGGDELSDLAFESAVQTVTSVILRGLAWSRDRPCLPRTVFCCPQKAVPVRQAPVYQLASR